MASPKNILASSCIPLRRAANQSNCRNWFKATDQKRDRGEPSLIAGITRQIIGTYCVRALQYVED